MTRNKYVAPVIGYKPTKSKLLVCIKCCIVFQRKTKKVVNIVLLMMRRELVR